MSRGIVLALAAPLLAVATATPAPAAPEQAAFPDASLLGLQRGLQVQKKVSIPLESEAETEEESWLDTAALGLQRSSTIVKKADDAASKKGHMQKSAVGVNDVIAAALDAEDVAPETWLDGTALGLQRGFVVKKKKKAVQPPATPSSSGKYNTPPDWIQATTLGLQRGLVVKKKAPSSGSAASGASATAPVADAPAAQVSTPSNVEQQEETAADWVSYTALGLQRGFKVSKKKQAPASGGWSTANATNSSSFGVGGIVFVV